MEDFDGDPTMSAPHNPCTCLPPAAPTGPVCCATIGSVPSLVTYPYHGGLLPGDPPRRALPVYPLGGAPRHRPSICNFRILRAFSLL